MQSTSIRHTAVTAACLAAGLLLAPGAHAQFPDAPRENLPPLPERKAAVLKEFDKDGDARLNTEERETARKAWEKRKFTERSDQGFFPLGVGFSDWYERWLDSTLAGGDGVWWMSGTE